MRFPIDVLFLDAEGTVLGARTIAPWRISRWYSKSRGVLELSSGTLEQTGTQPGDRLEFTGFN